MPLSERAAHKKDIRNGLDGCESFQHRHLAALAALISTLPDEAGNRLRVTEHFESAIRVRNPRFDGERFRAACLVNGPGSAKP